MVYTSPTKVAHVVHFQQLGMSRQDIATQIGIHRTTVGRILTCFKKSEDPYFVNPKKGCPQKLKERETRLAARMLAKTEAANVTELTKKALPNISCHTLGRALKKYGLVCRVRKSRPYISKPNQEKRRLWAMSHA